MAGDRPLIEDERFREKVAAVEVELKALEMTQMRVLSEDRQRKNNLPNPKSSILKIKGSEIQQATTQLLLGDRRARWRCPTRPRRTTPSSAPTSRPSTSTGRRRRRPRYFNYRKTTIYGGSNEIQRNILAKAVLGF